MSSKVFLPKGTNETPFNPQLQHFDFICGQVIKENRLLKFIVVVAVISFLLSIAVTFYAVSLPDTVPVLITMNDFGETHYIGEVSRKNYEGFQVPEKAMTAQVKKFITLYNTVSTDKQVMKNNVNEIYHILTSVTASKYSSLIKENNPYADFGTKTKEVVFETEDPLKLSNDSYQIDYRLITRLLDGRITDDEVYRAVISVKTLKPSKEDIETNYLGIYITGFDMKRITRKNISN